MRRTAAFVATMLLAAGTSAAEPYYDVFRYEKARPPVAGDCAAIAAAIGPDATWYGEIAGRGWDSFTDKYYPFSARGCFESEFDCRIWQNQALTYMDRGPMNYTFCRRGQR